jgi:hypothetical protein
MQTALLQGDGDDYGRDKGNGTSTAKCWFSDTARDSQPWGTLRKLATATQLRFPRIVADFKQATGFQIIRRTLRKCMVDQLLTSSEVGRFVRRNA